MTPLAETRVLELMNQMKKEFSKARVLLRPWIFVVTVCAAAIQMSMAWGRHNLRYKS